MMSEESNFDLSKLTFEEFERFFFDRPIIRQSKGKYFDTVFCPEMFSFASSRPEVTVASLERMFKEFERIGGQYTLKQINQGIWALLGPTIEIQEHLWNATISLADRVLCLRSMLVPYRDFVCGHPVKEMENCFDMWWDMVASSFWMPMKKKDPKSLNEDQRVLLDGMFATLCDILQLPDLRCRAYALHGLGHLHHPGVRGVVQKYIDKNRKNWRPENVRWVERCRDGTVM